MTWKLLKEFETQIFFIWTNKNFEKSMSKIFDNALVLLTKCEN